MRKEVLQVNEAKRCVKWLAIYCLLLAINIILETSTITYSFPLHSFSTIYLLILSVCLILRYYLKVAGKTKMKPAMQLLSYMIFLLILLRGIKYSVFGNIAALGRYTWYLYYLPMLCIPVLLFFVSLYVYAEDEQQIKRKWGWAAIVTVILVLLVLTNDLHQWVFRFQPGFANWDSDYSYGWGFTIVTVWEYLMYIAAVAVLIAKCSISKIKHRAWLILIPFGIGIAMLLLLITGTMPKLNGHTPIELPEALCFMAAGALECCMQLGLIPTNESYRGLMQITSVPVQITDNAGVVLYKSDTAQELTKEQFSAPDKARIGEHTILRRMEIPGGYGFWQNDVAELDRLNEELAEAKERLSEEGELIRLQNELKEKQKTIEQRTLVYDDIAKRTQRQSMAISRIAQQAMHTEDAEQKDKCRKQIALLGSYIKRYANLMLLSSESNTVSVGELSLSVAEVLRYLNLYGIPGELLNTASGYVPAEKALAVFEVFEALLENHLADLRGVYTNLSTQDGGLIFKLTLENMLTDDSESIREKLNAAGIQTLFEHEDNVGYFSFLLPKGGDEL